LVREDVVEEVELDFDGDPVGAGKQAVNTATSMKMTYKYRNLLIGVFPFTSFIFPSRYYFNSILIHNENTMITG
jgi:hypothetical protein